MKRTTQQVIAEQQAINRKLWAKENGRLHHLDANKLISEFMGYENVGTLSNPMYEYGESGGCRSLEDLCYHSSWNWLMPVIKKINKQISPNVSGLWRMITHPYEYHIEDVFSQVVEFINQNNNNNE